MNFHDNINNLVSSFKKTDDYVKYIALKEELKQNSEVYNTLKTFKEKQSEVQITYLNGQEISAEKRQEMEELYAKLASNDKCRELLECEMRLNVVLADLQKAIGDAVEEIVKF